MSKSSDALAKRKPSGKPGFHSRVQSTVGRREKEEPVEYPLIQAALRIWELKNGITTSKYFRRGASLHE